jgi:heme-degrading monooxygenase HmoA
MGLAAGRLKSTPGMRFLKLLGTGAEGFSTRPDWGVYGVLQVWDTEASAVFFFKNHPQFQRYLRNAGECLTIYMRPVKSKGKWNGINPFEPAVMPEPGNGALAVITRATIHKKYLRTFWKNVPASQRPLKGIRGLIYTKGIGETPFVDMATFSLWSDEEAMKAYAYGTKAHQEVIRKTRELGWYKEELFARFQPYKITGDWKDIADLTAFRESLKRRNTSL